MTVVIKNRKNLRRERNIQSTKRWGAILTANGVKSASVPNNTYL